MPLTCWCPKPTPIQLGGEFYMAHELRLWCLAELERYAAAMVGSPLAFLDPESEDYAESLKSAFDSVAEGWPPPVSSALVNGMIFGTTEGYAVLLSLVLRDEHEEVHEFLAESLTEDERSAIERIAWGIEDDQRAKITKLIDAHLGFPDLEYQKDFGPGGQSISWSKAVGEVVAHLPWATPEQVGNLTLSQWRLVRAGGEEEPASDPLPADPAIREQVMKARQEFWGIKIGEPVEGMADDEQDAPPPGSYVFSMNGLS